MPRVGVVVVVVDSGCALRRTCCQCRVGHNKSCAVAAAAVVAVGTAGIVGGGGGVVSRVRCCCSSKLIFAIFHIVV